MTQLIPAVMRYDLANARFIHRVLGENKEILEECFYDRECSEKLDDMQRTIFELILNNKEVVQ